MANQSNRYPSEADAAQLVAALLHAQPIQITRFRTGLAHYVYDVATTDRHHLVVRMAAASADSLNGAVYWSERLRPLNVPLPAILGDDRRATITPFPALILEWLPGSDLGYVYHLLSTAQKAALAAEIVRIQRQVGALPPGPGYGYATSYGDQGLLPTWADVVEWSLARSHAQIREIGYVDPAHVERVRMLARQFSAYFARVPPQPFLDDTTTKNVLIHNGQLSGIVDVDYICFGDPLFTVALTQMALLSMGADLAYTDAWCDLLALNDEQRAALQLYTCVFCVDFLSEVGHAANHNAPATIDEQRVTHLFGILQTLLHEI
jgi:Ser/Thr protein kinase RdoA (MazF antagonist)